MVVDEIAQDASRRSREQGSHMWIVFENVKDHVSLTSIEPDTAIPSAELLSEFLGVWPRQVVVERVPAPAVPVSAAMLTEPRVELPDKLVETRRGCDVDNEFSHGSSVGERWCSHGPNEWANTTHANFEGSCDSRWCRLPLR